jgi:hypothetical protein
MNAKEFIDTLKIISLDYSGEILKREMFSLAKEFKKIPVIEIVKLLKDENDNHRLGAVSILN